MEKHLLSNKEIVYRDIWLMRTILCRNFRTYDYAPMLQITETSSYNVAHSFSSRSLYQMVANPESDLDYELHHPQPNDAAVQGH